jgi:hypothetical protein
MIPEGFGQTIKVGIFFSKILHSGKIVILEKYLGSFGNLLHCLIEKVPFRKHLGDFFECLMYIRCSPNTLANFSQVLSVNLKNRLMGFTCDMKLGIHNCEHPCKFHLFIFHISSFNMDNAVMLLKQLAYS